MALTYKTRYGADWPAEMPDPLIGMVIGKKWRLIKAERGVEFADPWVPLLDAAKALIPEQYFRVPPWTEEHFHDWVMAEKGCITWGCASCGKALLPDEPVYFKDRVGKIGEVRPGDFIFAATGNLARVQSVHRQVDMPLYRVKFADGAEVVCAKDHLWTVRYWSRVRWEGLRASRRAVRGWRTETVPVDRLASWTSLARRRVSIPLTAPVQFPARDVPLDPYVLGVLLGDASMTGTVLLASCEADVELRDEVGRRLERQFPHYGLTRVRGSKTSYMVVNRIGLRNRNPVVAALRTLGLYGHVANSKFVPDCYKLNSVAVRTELLAGLFDTDGTVGKSGHASFTTVSRALAEDVKFMLGSIGASATITTRATGRQPAYTVYVRATNPEIVRSLFRLSRKRDRVRSSGRGVGRRGVVSVTPIEDRDGFSRETVCITLADRDVRGLPTDGLFPISDFVVTHNSNDYGLLMLLDWVTDPYDTVVRLGSTDKQSLKSRSWNAVVTYFAALKKNKLGLAIPGKFSKSGYAILNDDADDSPESVGEKAGIVGVAVNDSEDSGKLQGAHAKFVRLVIDELATITHHDNIRKAMQNLRVGALDFRFFALANPASWEDESCQYCIPPGGPASVGPETGLWTSTRGFLVRHHDGHRCITVERPETAKEFPFLVTREVIAQNLADCDGNADAPMYWQMVRGFPVPSASNVRVVLDSKTAAQARVTERVIPDPFGIVDVAAGIDPAWTEGGDGAVRAKCTVRRDMYGHAFLDFTDGVSKIPIKANDPRPPMQQMMDFVIDAMRRPGEATFHNTAVDSSANQGLADGLLIFAGADCLGVNNAERASDQPLRAKDSRLAKQIVYDRGTEAWYVLAEFCRARMVRGLPPEALRGLVMRRFVMREEAGVVMNPLRLESKKVFKTRFGKSPDETDACALAALAVKERLGIVPFGDVPSIAPGALLSTAPVRPRVNVVRDESWGCDALDGGEGYTTPG